MLTDELFKLEQTYSDYTLLKHISGHERYDTLWEAKESIVDREVYVNWDEMYDWLMEIGKHRLLFTLYKIVCAQSRENPIRY